MDKKIKKIEKEIDEKHLKSAKKDLKGLLKADKKQDKEVAKLKMKKHC